MHTAKRIRIPSDRIGLAFLSKKNDYLFCFDLIFSDVRKISSSTITQAEAITPIAAIRLSPSISASEFNGVTLKTNKDAAIAISK